MKNNFVIGAALLMAGFVCAPSIAHAEGEWVSLFDGKTLKGWVQHNGTATYEVVDGTIKGTTSPGSPNSFLCSEKLYGDFELEFEVKVHNELNSGVQIRSQQKDGNGRVNGPQVEIEASGENGAEAGYVYGEATGRGWLTREAHLKPHKYFMDGEWNKYRIVAKGNRIQTWINDKPVADLIDDQILETHPKGFIGLQVHSIGKDKGPFDVAWKNIRIKEL